MFNSVQWNLVWGNLMVSYLMETFYNFLYSYLKILNQMICICISNFGIIIWYFRLCCSKSASKLTFNGNMFNIRVHVKVINTKKESCLSNYNKMYFYFYFIADRLLYYNLGHIMLYFPYGNINKGRMCRKIRNAPKGLK